MRILLADDHAIVRRHVRNILLAQTGWEVCAEAATGREAVTMTAKEHPDLVVLDLSMPGLNGIEAARLIHEQFPEMDMIVLSMHEPYEVMDQLAGSGVRAVRSQDGPGGPGGRHSRDTENSAPHQQL
jgi:two-component system response regulator DegU